jgi:hypothetical protein
VTYVLEKTIQLASIVRQDIFCRNLLYVATFAIMGSILILVKIAALLVPLNVKVVSVVLLINVPFVKMDGISLKIGVISLIVLKDIIRK